MRSGVIALCSFLLISLVLINFGSAEVIDVGTFKSIEPVNISLYCIYNGTYCPTASYDCNVTIKKSSSILVNNQKMGEAFNPLFNFTLPNSSGVGNYQGKQVCCSSTNCIDKDFIFKVTPGGNEPKGDNFFMFFIILFLVLTFCFIFILFYTIGGLMSLRTDIMDVSLNLGVYFVTLAYTSFVNAYIPDTIITTISSFMLSIIIYTNVILPLIALAFTLILGTWLRKQFPNLFGRMPGAREAYNPGGGN